MLEKVDEKKRMTRGAGVVQSKHQTREGKAVIVTVENIANGNRHNFHSYVALCIFAVTRTDSYRCVKTQDNLMIVTEKEVNNVLEYADAHFRNYTVPINKMRGEDWMAIFWRAATSL